MAKSLVLNRTRKVPAEDTAAFGAIAERFRRAGALERAVELCREGLQKFPDHISARVTLGWSLLDLGKYDESRTELEQVLRRAPDNLAAIRGLAELHDRFEHTLHLPMDGPGQWPPPPESVDAAGTQAEASATDQGAADANLEMTPAALGIPIWSPAVTPTPEAETPVAQAAPVPATEPAPSTDAPVTPVPARAKAAKPAKAPKKAAAAPKAAPAPVAAPEPPPAPAPAATVTAAPASTTAAAAAQVPTPAPAPAPVASAPIAVSEPVRVEAATSGSGMSSVREIDFAPAVSESVPAPAPAPAMQEPSIAAAELRDERAETTELAADAYAVSDADIQALIAEAESLDAASVVTPAESETVSLEAMAAETEDPLSAVAEIAPLAPAYTSVTEAISVDLDLDAAPADIAAAEETLTMEAASAEAVPEVAAPVAEAALTAEEAFEAALEIAAPIVEAALQIEEPVVAACSPVDVAAAEAAVEAEEAFEAALEVAAPIVEAALEIEEPVVVAQAESEVAREPEIEIAAAIDVSPAIAPAPEVDLVSEIEVAPAIAAMAAAEVVELAPVAAAAEVVSIELGRTAARSPVPALERFLTKVQARRAQLMTESVA